MNWHRHAYPITGDGPILSRAVYPDGHDGPCDNPHAVTLVAGAWRGQLDDVDIAVTVYSDGTANYITRSHSAGPWDQWSPPVALIREEASV
jgi:hypothetical protein